MVARERTRQSPGCRSDHREGLRNRGVHTTGGIMRKSHVISAMLIALVAMSAILAPSALSGSSARERHGVELLHITSATAQETVIDAAPANEFSVGDSYVFSEDLFKGATRIGDAGGECMTVRIDGASSAVAHCTETFRLPAGQI